MILGFIITIQVKAHRPIPAGKLQKMVRRWKQEYGDQVR
jgi:hypothetical protein